MKTIKVFIVAIVILIIGLLIAEGITYKLQSNRLVREGYTFSTEDGKPPYPKKVGLFSSYYEQNSKYGLLLNRAGLEYDNNSIFVFGDVYVNDLADDNAFTHRLATLSRKPVYNFASAGWGIPHMYFLLENEEYMSRMKQPDTILFVYNGDLKNRLTSFSFYPHHTFLNLKYKVEDGILIEDVPQALFLYRSYFYRALERANGFRLSKSKNPKIQQKNFELMEKLFDESKRVAEVKFPQFKKFVVLRYVDEDSSLDKLEKMSDDVVAQLEYNLWKKLEDRGFVVVDVSSLSDVNYSDNTYFSDDHSLNNEGIESLLSKLVNRVEL